MSKRIPNRATNLWLYGWKLRWRITFYPTIGNLCAVVFWKQDKIPRNVQFRSLFVYFSFFTCCLLFNNPCNIPFRCKLYVMKHISLRAVFSHLSAHTRIFQKHRAKKSSLSLNAQALWNTTPHGLLNYERFAEVAASTFRRVKGQENTVLMVGPSILWYRCKMTNKCVKKLVDLLMYYRFTPTCFGKWLPSSGNRRCLKSHSSNICVVGVYGLLLVYSWIHSTTGHTGRIVIRIRPQHRYHLSMF
jgi:hypothetical protein